MRTFLKAIFYSALFILVLSPVLVNAQGNWENSPRTSTGTMTGGILNEDMGKISPSSADILSSDSKDKETEVQTTKTVTTTENSKIDPALPYGGHSSPMKEPVVSKEKTATTTVQKTETKEIPAASSLDKKSFSSSEKALPLTSIEKTEVKDLPVSATEKKTVATSEKTWLTTEKKDFQSKLNSKNSDDIRKQKFEDFEGGSSIEKEFNKAKTTQHSVSLKKKAVEEVKPVSVTDQEIINSLVASNLRTQKIDLDFDEVKLSDIFMTLGSAAGINVLLDPALKNQTMDLHLQQVPIEESFMLIANAFNLGFKKIGSSLYVTDREKLRQQNFVSKVIKLKNIDAQVAKSMISSIIKIINVGEEINSLIVIGDATEISEVEKILKTIDVPQPQVVLEAKIIEVNRDALKDLGIDWSDQVTLDYQESGRPVTLANTEDAGRGVLEIAKFQRSPIQFSTIIKMLENQNKAKVLSNPRVTTLNDKEAEIFVGDRIPYTVTTISGGVATTDVRFEEPGIRLRITPSIIQDDFVVIKVEPEVSFIFSFRGPNDQYPWVKKRQATAYVRVRNNQPFVLGGLLNQEDKKNLYKVPMIGDIPLLGNLFSYERHTVLDTELIITITPTVVEGDLLE